MTYRAMIFATIAHGDQKRKYTGMPYIVHPMEVANILKAARKEIDRVHISKASYAGKTVKLADIISNTSTITKYDKKFAKIYLAEKLKLLEVLTDGNKELHKFASDMCEDYMNELNTARAD